MKLNSDFKWIFALNFLLFLFLSMAIVPRIFAEAASYFTFGNMGWLISLLWENSIYSCIAFLAMAAALGLIFSLIISKIKALKNVEGLGFFFGAEFILFFGLAYFLFLKWFHVTKLVKANQGFLTATGIAATAIITILFIIIGAVLYYATKAVLERVKNKKFLRDAKIIAILVIAFTCCFVAAEKIKAQGIYKIEAKGSETSNLSGYNILLITYDALRHDHLGYAGYYRNTSPNLDTFASQSAVFTQATTAWPKTSPSFAATFTGLPGKTNGIRKSVKVVLPENLATLAEMLKNSGYYTAAFVANPVLAKIYNLDQGFDNYYEHNGGLGIAKIEAEHVIEVLRASGDKKFFMWAHFIDPHGPYNPTGNYHLMFVNDSFYNKSIKILLGDTTYAETTGLIPQYVNENNITERDYYIAEYDAEIRQNDEQFARIISAVDEIGIRNRTIIIFASDHGESLGDHGYYFSHGLFGYDDCVRIPMIFNAPWMIENKTISHPVSNIDILPTILSFLNIAAPDFLQGQNLMPVILGLENESKLRKYTFSEAGYATGYIREVRDEQGWKLIYTPDKHVQSLAQKTEFELYNILADPGETQNIAGGYPEKVEELKKVLLEWMEKDTVSEVE